MNAQTVRSWRITLLLWLLLAAGGASAQEHTLKLQDAEIGTLIASLSQEGLVRPLSDTPGSSQR